MDLGPEQLVPQEKQANPFHIPVYPPSRTTPSFPTAYSDIIDQKCFETIVSAACGVQSHTKMLSMGMSVLCLSASALLFIYSIARPSLFAIIALGATWGFTAYGLDGVMRPVLNLLDERYLARLRAAMASVEASESLSDAGVSLRVRSFNGTYRQPWDAYPKQFSSSLKVAVVIECPAVQPISYSLGVEVHRGRHAWDAAYPASLAQCVSPTEWAAAVKALDSASVGGAALALALVITPVAVITMLVGASIGVAWALPDTTTGRVLAILAVVASVTVGYLVALGAALAYRTRIQHRRASLTAAVQRVCDTLNAAGTAEWRFAWRSDSVGVTRAFIATPVVTVTAADTEDLERHLGGAPTEPAPRAGAIEAYPVADRDEGPRTGLLSQRVRGDADAFV